MSPSPYRRGARLGRILVLCALAGVGIHPARGGESDKPASGPRYFGIRVLDDATGRGVPLVELQTVYHTSYYTDSAGWVAFFEPGLMDRDVFFSVQSHGYEFPKDGFGYRGKILHTTPGTRAELKIKRLNLAERLYRVTGAGIYADSLLLGEPVPIRQPLLNAQVAGQDSVMAAVWRDRIWWFWGDTQRPKYPLGQFQVSGATSALPGQGGLPPSQGVDLEYFVDGEGFSRPMCPMPSPQPVWIEGLAAVPDAAGQVRLAARYTRMKDLGEMLEHGLAVFDPQQQRFVKHVEFDLADSWRCPRGQAFTQTEAGRPYVVFADPFPVCRVEAKFERLADPRAYEAFTCLTPGSREADAIERDAQGRAVYGWKADSRPTGQAEERKLLAAGKLRAEEARCQVRDAEGGRRVELHKGSIRWNAYRKRWIMIAVQRGGTSFLGEIYFLEAPQPTGPWSPARKIVSHAQYTFYNPVQHAFFDEEDGRRIYFEGTYAVTFSGNPHPTPRYDYNQIMYRLDLKQMMKEE